MLGSVSQASTSGNTIKHELSGIQLLRGVAALAVVIHHTLEISNGAAGRFSPDWITTSGASGVDLFFVISGFIMLYVSFAQPVALSTGDFLLKRIKRIYPFYWICCLLMLLMHFAGFMKHNPLTKYDILASFLLLPSAQKLINVSWTLVYEIYFYLIFAVSLRFGSRGLSVIIPTSVIIGGYLLLPFLSGSMAASFFGNPVPIEFCMGLCLAWLFLRFMDTGKCWPRGFLIGFLAFGLLALAPVFISHPNTNGLPYRVVAWGVPAVFVVAASLTLGQPRNVFARFMVLLGDASYALYLTHEFFMVGYGWFIKTTALGKINQLYVVPIIVIAAVIFGIMAHILIERPLISKTRKLELLTIRKRIKSNIQPN